MSEQTDSIIQLAQSIANYVPPSSSPPAEPPSSVAWPEAIDCLGGVPASQIAIVIGDGVPTGQQGEPAYSRRLANMPGGSVGIFGDSIIQAMHENLAHSAAVNYALGGQSLRRMINGLHGFGFMRAAGAGVILCGVNDLSNTTYYGPRTNQQAALTVLGMFQNKLAPWMTGKWVICHLLPCDEIVSGAGATGYNEQCQQVNNGLANAMSATAAQIAFVPVNPAFVDSAGNLKAEYHLDGQHLNKAGTALLASGIRSALSQLGL